MTMIDALELAVPEHACRRQELWANSPARRIRSKQFYLWQVDFRPKLRLIVYYGHGHPIPKKDRHYKLQFVNTATLTEDDFTHQVGQLFLLTESEICSLKVMRVDFAVNVRSVSVQWFRETCVVRCKQTYEEIRRWDECTSPGYTSLKIGKRPDLYRIYDKVDEIKHRTGHLRIWAKSLGSLSPLSPEWNVSAVLAEFPENSKRWTDC